MCFSLFMQTHVWSSRPTLSLRTTQHNTNKQHKQVEEYIKIKNKDSPPPLWAACISCTPSATSSPCVCVSLSVCVSVYVSQWVDGRPSARRDVCNVWRRVSMCEEEDDRPRCSAAARATAEGFHRNRRTESVWGGRTELGSRLSPPFTPRGSQAARTPRPTPPEHRGPGLQNKSATELTHSRYTVYACFSWCLLVLTSSSLYPEPQKLHVSYCWSFNYF